MNNDIITPKILKILESGYSLRINREKIHPRSSINV